MSLDDWLRCPDCRRTTVGLEHEKKSTTMQCYACGYRETQSYGFNRPVFIGHWDRALVHEHLENGIRDRDDVLDILGDEHYVGIGAE